jgi:hypothetical protein
MEIINIITKFKYSPNINVYKLNLKLHYNSDKNKWKYEMNFFIHIVRVKVRKHLERINQNFVKICIFDQHR